MTSSKKSNPVEVCGTCVHRIEERGAKGQYITRCKLSHTVKTRDLMACQYYERRE